MHVSYLLQAENTIRIANIFVSVLTYGLFLHEAHARVFMKFSLLLVDFIIDSVTKNIRYEIPY